MHSIKIIQGDRCWREREGETGETEGMDREMESEGEREREISKLLKHISLSPSFILLLYMYTVITLSDRYDKIHIANKDAVKETT